jgi:hypothetical protein
MGKVAVNGVAAEGGGKNETSAGRSCFGNENDEGMGCFSDLGRNEKCRSEVSRRRGNGHQCFSAMFRHRRNEQCRTVVFQHRRNEQCCTAVFQHHEKSSVLKTVFQHHESLFSFEELVFPVLWLCKRQL